MASSLAKHQDILKLPAPQKPWPRISRRVGIHTSIAGGVENAAERAWRLGCTTFQIFSSSPRQWKPYELGRKQCNAMRGLREKYDLKPLVIHANYLINVAGTTAYFHSRSIEAFRGEVERALALCAEYLVLHPGSYRGGSREEGLVRAAQAIEAATRGSDLAKGGLTVLIENTAGAEFSLGGNFEQVAELVQRLRGIIPVAACIDTCHVHVAGYDIVSEEGMRQTLRYLELAIGLRNIPVWHCNDAKAVFGSKLDRHQHIGKGTIGLEPFRRLLSDPRLAQAAFIAETPIDVPGDDMRNVGTLRSLASRKKAFHHGDTEIRKKAISD
ncbi:MAG TPA: deoxyribonuclease IV [Terriglobales bacterium]|jgi:deoxyribonuclease-4|nr:deoxyribonuclease IV [Terriglobales bacterium]